MNLKNKHILLGVTGGIAAYKSAMLVRMLRQEGAEVKVVMTESAKQFVMPLTFETLSGHPIYDDMFKARSESATQHISLARWADMILVAPATANFIAHIAHGFADDLLSAICLASTAPIILAPAMNHNMWNHVATRENVEILKKRRVKIVGPAVGEQACGENGIGCMVEPIYLVKALIEFYKPGCLLKKKVLITAGPTREAIDPVRFIGNHSSGKMGYAIAEAAINAGAEVTLISGPVHLETPVGVHRVDVVSADEMFNKVMAHIEKVDIFISVAAVADYGVNKPATQKIKRQKNLIALELTKNPDILHEVTKLPNKPFVVGFALESENLVANAEKKKNEKGLDIIVANLVDQDGAGLYADECRATILYDNQVRDLGLQSKEKIAKELLCLIAKQMQ